jgi:hypothetical protein
MTVDLKSDPSSRLWQWLEDVVPSHQGLVWCHTTDSYAFRDIMESGVCKLEACEVPAEKLLYLFYGRPAFRVRDDHIGKAGVAPVVLLFDESLIHAGKRLYPFDSGAFNHNYYEQWFHRRMALKDFELACTADAARKVIAAFFGSAVNYLKTAAQMGSKSCAGDFEVAAVFDLFRTYGTYRSQGGNADSPSAREPIKVDDRRIAVELQLDADVSLDEQVLRAVIYPDELGPVEWLERFKRTHPSIMFSEYMTGFDKTPGNFQALLEDRAFGLQKEMGYV